MDEISQTVEKQFVEQVHFKTGQRCFRPEFIGRIMRRGGIVAFNALSEEALRGIARHMFDKVARDYSGVHESKLICDDAVINMIAHMVYEENEETIRHKGDGYYGGRRLDIMMNEHVTNKLAAQIRQLAGAPMVRVVLNGKAVVNADISEWKDPLVNPDGTQVPSWHRGFPALSTIPTRGRVGFQGVHGDAGVRIRSLRIAPL